MDRLSKRSIFLTGDRQLKVVFYTSSTAKFSQARVVLGTIGIELSLRKHDSEPYSELYDQSKEELIRASVAQVRNRGGGSTLFFVEDTTVRIEALSPSADDVPGLSTKEWFSTTSFSALHQSLLEAGDDRRATVKSCIGLFIPVINEVELFYGETTGVVCQPGEIASVTSPVYPWLDADSFNAWFVPEGANRVISMMSLEASIEHDFRAQALLRLADRLEQFAAVLNAPGTMIIRKQHRAASQQSLFPVVRQVVIVVGPTCSGKTTMGHYVAEIEGWTYIDASDVVRILRSRRDRESEEISDFAHDLLANEGPDVVARFIFETYLSDQDQRNVIITGFRAIEEVQFFRNTVENVRVISLEAPQRVRFLRYLERNSRTRIGSLDEFKLHDERQFRLGLLRVAADISDIRVENAGSLETFVDQVRFLFGEIDTRVGGISKPLRRLRRSTSQLVRCLSALRDAGTPLTTQELQKRLPADDIIRYNNANKILKRYPELAARQESADLNVKYQITQHGLAFLSAMKGLSGAAVASLDRRKAEGISTDRRLDPSEPE
ncbi:MAG: AAA family ATPase [Acidobacteria bacterium]|nr:AAA family ATPase [Acidobacteriota bacterium]